MKEEKINTPEAPTPEELRSERPLPDEALIEETPRPQAGVEAARDALDRYFREMIDHPLLAPEAELAAASEIERLEVGLWRAMLAHPIGAPIVMSAAESSMDNSLPEFAELRRLLEMQQKRPGRFKERGVSRFKDTVLEAAEKLRRLDIDRAFVASAQSSLEAARASQELPRDRVTSAYLARVARARRHLTQAKHRFVAANLRLVVSMARRYNRGQMPLSDIIQEGNLGLMKAVERFDYRRGYRFSTYASWWIRHAITRAMADKARAVRIPVHMLDTVQRVKRARALIETRLGREATPEEIEAETGVAPSKLLKIRSSWTAQAFSLDRPIGGEDEEGERFIDRLQEEEPDTPYDRLATESWGREVGRLLWELTPMEARIIRWRFGLDDEEQLTLREIGEKYHLSRERIRQIQEQALAKMRKRIEEG